MFIIILLIIISQTKQATIEISSSDIITATPIDSIKLKVIDNMPKTTCSIHFTFPSEYPLSDTTQYTINGYILDHIEFTQQTYKNKLKIYFSFCLSSIGSIIFQNVQAPNYTKPFEYQIQYNQITNIKEEIIELSVGVLNIKSKTLVDFSYAIEDDRTQQISSIQIEFQPTIPLVKNNQIEIGFPTINTNEGEILYDMIFDYQCQPLFGMKDQVTCYKQGSFLIIEAYDQTYENTNLDRVGIKVNRILTPHSTKPQQGFSIKTKFQEYYIESVVDQFLQVNEIGVSDNMLINMLDKRIGQKTTIQFIVFLQFFLKGSIKMKLQFNENIDLSEVEWVGLKNVKENRIMTINENVLIVDDMIDQQEIEYIFIFELTNYINLDYEYSQINELKLDLSWEENGITYDIIRYENIGIINEILDTIVISILESEFIVNSEFNLDLNVQLSQKCNKDNKIIIILPQEIVVQQDNIGVQDEQDNELIFEVDNNKIIISQLFSNEIKEFKQNIRIRITRLLAPSYKCRLIDLQIYNYWQDYRIEQNENSLQLEFEEQALTIDQLNLENKQVNAINKLEIIISLDQTLYKDDWIIIQYSFVNEDIVCLLNNIEHTYNIINDQMYIQNQQDISSQLTIHLQSLQNLRSLQPYTSLFIQFLNSRFQLLAKTNQQYTISMDTIQSLQQLEITSTHQSIDTISQYTLSFISTVDIIPQDILTIQFPPQFELNNIICIPLNKPIFQSCTTTQTNIIQFQFNLSIQSNTPIKFSIQGVHNPSIQQLNEVTISISDSLSYLISQASSSFQLIPAKLNSISLINLTPYTSSTTQLNLAFTNTILIPSNSYIYIIHHEEYNHDDIQIPNYIHQLINLTTISILLPDQLNPNTLSHFIINNLINPSEVISWNQLQFQVIIYNSQDQQVQTASLYADWDIICQPNCKTCISETCNACYPPYNLYSTQCLDICPSSMVPINGLCQECFTSSTCFKCSEHDLTKCMICQENYELIDGQCIEIKKKQEENIPEDIRDNEEKQQEPSLSEEEQKQEEEIIEEEEKQQSSGDQDQEKKNGINLNYKQKLDENKLGLIYLLIFEVVILIIVKIIRRQYNLFLTMLFLEGLMDPILIMTSLIIFMINAELPYLSFTICYSIGNFLQMIHSQQLLWNLLRLDTIYIGLISQKLVGKLINGFTLFYDWKVVLIFLSKITNNPIFNVDFQLKTELYKRLVFLMKLKLMFFQPIMMLISMVYLINGNKHSANFQLDYLLYNSIHFLVQGYVFWILTKVYKAQQQSDVQKMSDDLLQQEDNIRPEYTPNQRKVHPVIDQDE